MNRRSRAFPRSSKSHSETFHKYLKPGALAQIRNSRMIARFNRVNLISQIYSTRSSSLSPPTAPIDSALLQVSFWTLKLGDYVELLTKLHIDFKLNSTPANFSNNAEQLLRT
ncbi:hypothetical protein SDJN03_17729, partial [Cucurbita argyrosperma subsp. sororia]